MPKAEWVPPTIQGRRSRVLRAAAAPRSPARPTTRPWAARPRRACPSGSSTGTIPYGVAGNHPDGVLYANVPENGLKETDILDSKSQTIMAVETNEDKVRPLDSGHRGHVGRAAQPERPAEVRPDVCVQQSHVLLHAERVRWPVRRQFEPAQGVEDVPELRPEESAELVRPSAAGGAGDRAAGTRASYNTYSAMASCGQCRSRSTWRPTCS